jgi:hypothetical protein
MRRWKVFDVCSEAVAWMVGAETLGIYLKESHAIEAREREAKECGGGVTITPLYLHPCRDGMSHSALLAACKAVVEEFGEWDCEEERPVSKAAKARNKRVRILQAAKAAIAAATSGEGEG